MRDYMKEIQDCSERIEALKKEHSRVYHRFDKITREINNELYDVLSEGFMVKTELAGILAKQLTHINSEIEMLKARRSLLRTMYNRAHSRDFYKPMDRIDIYMTIERDGSIRGRLL